MLGLLLIEVSGESNDVGVDLLVTDGTALTVCRHGCVFVEYKRDLGSSRWVSAGKEVVVVVVVCGRRVRGNCQINAFNISSRRCWQLAARLTAGYVGMISQRWSSQRSVRAMDDTMWSGS